MARPLLSSGTAAAVAGAWFLLCDPSTSPAESLDVKRWDEFTKDAGIVPIVIAPESTTQAAVDQLHDRWLARGLLKPALASLNGDSDEAELTPLLEGIVHRYSGVDASVADVATNEKIRRFAKRTTRQPCVDFLLGAGLVAANFKDEADLRFHAAADAPEDPSFPLLFRLIAQGYVVNEASDFGRGDKKAAEKRYFELFTSQAASALDEDDLHFTVYQHFQYPINSVRFGREKHYIEILNASPLPEWARLTCIGAAETQLAWRESNRGMSPEPDKPAKKRRDEAIARARAAFTKAWELNPSMPYAAWEMMVVGRMADDIDQAEFRRWFDRATAAVCDYLPVYNMYLMGMTPSFTRSHGSTLPGMLAFGRACAETRRFDLRIPAFFNKTLLRIGASLDDWRPLYAHPGVAKMLLETRQRSLELAPAGERALQWNELVLESWLTDRFDLAAQALSKIRGPDGIPLGSWTTMQEAQSLGLSLPVLYRDAELRAGPAREEYEAGVALLAKGKAGDAETDFKTALDSAGPYGRNLVESELVLAGFQKKFAAGEWAPIPLNERLLWIQHWGEAEWQAESKRLRLQSTTDFSRATFRGTLGANYELRGHLFATRDGKLKRAGLGIFSGYSPLGTGTNDAWWWTLRVDAADEHHFWIHHAMNFSGQPEKERKEVPWKEDTTFLYRLKNGRISFTINDQEVLHDAETDTDLPTGEGAFGFGILGHGAGSSVELWDWEARSLERAL